MTVEVKPNFILITDILNDQLFKRKYIGYSLGEAIEQFNIEYEDQEQFERNGLNSPWMPYENNGPDFQR